MVMDRTTLGRAIRPLQRDRLLTIAAGEDGRTRSLRLTTTGEARLKAATVKWLEAQKKFEMTFGAWDAAELRSGSMLSKKGFCGGLRATLIQDQKLIRNLDPKIRLPGLPNVNRVAVIYDPGGSSADGYLSAIEAGAPSFGVRSWPPFRMSELSPADWNGPIVKPVETGALRMCPDAGALTGNGRNPRGTQITLYESQNERREDRAMRRARNIRYRCGSAFPPARTWRPEGPCIGRSSCRPALQPGH